MVIQAGNEIMLASPHMLECDVRRLPLPGAASPVRGVRSLLHQHAMSKYTPVPDCGIKALWACIDVGMDSEWSTFVWRG